MRFYDTMSRSVQEFAPLVAGQATIYTCGPTVYRHSHIGNMRTYITADLLRRALEYEGLEVKQVTNITDVGHMTEDRDVGGEDKMLVAVEDEGLTAHEIAEKYTQAWLSHTAAVNVQPSVAYPKATDHIPEMLEINSKLIERGHAYEKDGFVYFDVDTFPDYGKLSRNTRDKLVAGHRMEELDTRKRNHYDFTLWRAAGPDRVLKWSSPWGEGFPGWHIECSAMSIKHLGERFDIHTGGSDNIFPHHECEIAQSEGAVGHDVVQRWLHGHHLLAEVEKMAKSSPRRMAKSAGNYYTVDDLVERGFDPLAFRYLVLQARYRAQTNFTWDALDAARRGLFTLRKQMAEWASPDLSQSEEGTSLDRRFAEAIGDDLDTPRALKVVSETVGAPIKPSEKFALLRKWDQVLGLDLVREVTSEQDLPAGAEQKIGARETARAEKNWEEADKLRSELLELGVELIDTPQGTRWVRR